jgi:light-regulated signal transduction histidine kinase (bacteriophytochrome)
MHGEADIAIEHHAQTMSLLEAEIERLHARNAELEREKADAEAFAAMAAHELLAPLVMIDAYAGMVSRRVDQDLDADSRRDLDALRRSAARTRLLVETLLEHACSTKRPLQRCRIDLNGVLHGCLTLLAPEIRSREAEVQVAMLPVVNAEETLISAVFTNLLGNALKYGPRTGGKILVDAAAESAGWRFSVQSQGATIPAEDHERIFEPYSRGRGERRARGSGLGLTLSRYIVERHGGEIGVGTASGGDNLFTFTLPA